MGEETFENHRLEVEFWCSKLLPHLLFLVTKQTYLPIQLNLKRKFPTHLVTAEMRDYYIGRFENERRMNVMANKLFGNNLNRIW